MNRRSFLKGMVATAAGIMVPAPLIDAEESARRFWALGALPKMAIYPPDKRIWVDGELIEVEKSGWADVAYLDVVVVQRGAQASIYRIGSDKKAYRLEDHPTFYKPKDEPTHMLWNNYFVR